MPAADTTKMRCPEYQRLAENVESRQKAYAFIRMNESKVRMSKRHYEDLVLEGYTSMTAAMKDLAWHELKCSACKQR